MFHYEKPYVVWHVKNKLTGDFQCIKDYRYNPSIHELVKKVDFVDPNLKPKDIVTEAVSNELERQKGEAKKLEEARAKEELPPIDLTAPKVEEPIKKRRGRPRKVK